MTTDYQFIKVLDPHEQRLKRIDADIRSVQLDDPKDQRKNPALNGRKLKDVYGLDPVTMRRAAIVQAGALSRDETVTASTAIHHQADRLVATQHLGRVEQMFDRDTLDRLVRDYTCAAFITESRTAVSDPAASQQIRSALERATPQATYHNSCPRAPEQRYPAFIPTAP